MLNIQRLISTTIICLSLLLSACSSVDEEAIARGSERSLYEQAQGHMKGENFPMAVAKLQMLESRFPFGKYAEQAQLELIYAHYRSSDYPEAIEAAERFVRLHPKHPNVDYAFYVKGLSSFTDGASFFDRFIPGDIANRDPGPARLSYSSFAELIARFPNSQYAADARARMVYLRNLLARHEIYVANYYFKRRAYISALRRGQFVLEQFPQTPAVPDGLAVVIQASKMMGLDEQADNALAVLKLNYPDYPSLSADGSFDPDFDDSGDRSIINQFTFGLFDSPNPPSFNTKEQYGG